MKIVVHEKNVFTAPCWLQTILECCGYWFVIIITIHHSLVIILVKLIYLIQPSRPELTFNVILLVGVN